jgi:magnesium-transporting ATPase (P-type)
MMEFKKCSIGGVKYDGAEDSKSDAKDHSAMGDSTTAMSVMQKSSRSLPGSPTKLHPQNRFFDPPLSPKSTLSNRHAASPYALSIGTGEDGAVEGGWYDSIIFSYLHDPRLVSSAQTRVIRDFFTLLSVCHTVLVESEAMADGDSQQLGLSPGNGGRTGSSSKSSSASNLQESEVDGAPAGAPQGESGSRKSIDGHAPPAAAATSTLQPPALPKNSVMSYKAQSPDEACLVSLAAQVGFVFHGRQHSATTKENEMVVQILGQEVKFSLLNVLEFDSDRKRMSVIVRMPRKKRAVPMGMGPNEHIGSTPHGSDWPSSGQSTSGGGLSITTNSGMNTRHTHPSHADSAGGDAGPSSVGGGTSGNDDDDTEIVLFCKGADTVIFERLDKGQKDIQAITSHHLEEFGQEGTWSFSQWEYRS